MSTTLKVVLLYKFIMKHFIFFVFVIYWSIIILFQFPKDSLLIGNIYKYKYYFDKYHYQNWSFFAPPPQNNLEIVYYLCSIDNKEIIKIDILKSIHDNIIKNFPINDSEIQMHYLFYVHADNVVNKTPKIYNALLTKNRRNNNLGKDKTLQKKLATFFANDRDYLFFVNHAQKIIKNINSKSPFKFRFEINSLDINKFNERNNPIQKKFDNYLFKSKEIIIF